MSTSHIYGPVLEAIRSGRTVLPCYALHYCTGSTEFKVITKTYNDFELRANMGNFKRATHPCTLRNGYKEDVFYCPENIDDNSRPCRSPHDTQASRIESFSPPSLRHDETPTAAISHLRSCWSELAPKFAASFTLLLPDGIARCADTQDNVIDNLKSITTESEMIDEIADGTQCYTLLRSSCESQRRYLHYRVFFLHKTPTLCMFVECDIDGLYVTTGLMTRTSPSDQWKEVRAGGDDSQADLSTCREFYSLFIALQQMQSDIDIFGHTIMPGASRSYGIEKYVNKAGFPVRVFNGY